MTDHAYHQDLVRQRDRAVAERRAAETELGRRRTQVAELTEQLATAQAAASERAAILEHARDLLEPWGGHGDAWPDIAPAIEALIGEARQQTTRAEQAEARIAELTGALQSTEDALTRVLRLAQQLPADIQAAINAAVDGTAGSTAAQPAGPSVTLRTIGHWRPACTSCRRLVHPGMDCGEAEADRAWAAAATVRLGQALDRALPHLGAAFVCEHRDPKKLGARPGDLALVCRCGAEVFPSPLPKARP